MLPVLALAMTVVTTLLNTASTAPVDAHQKALSVKTLKLDVSVRLALLQGCKLACTGMLVLLSSDEQVADSEDTLATLVYSYTKSAMGRACTAAQTKTLKDQLRYQHMSNAFVGCALQSMPSLSLNVQQLSQLLYLRGLKQFASIPVLHRLPTVPEAWYKPPRKQALSSLETVEISFDVPESALSEHLCALVRFKAGGAVAPTELVSGCVESKSQGTSWRMLLMSPSRDEQLWLVVRPSFVTSLNTVSWKANIYVDISYSIDGAATVMTGKTSTWVGAGGVCVKVFVPSETGDATDISWWKDYINDGHVRFRATVTVQP